DSVFDILNFEWNEDATLSKRKGYTQLAGNVSSLEEPDFILAPRVYTTQGQFPQYSQQVLYFNKDDGEMFYNSLGELWAEYLNDDGSDLATSGHSLGVGSDTAINRFRVWPI